MTIVEDTCQKIYDRLDEMREREDANDVVEELIGLLGNLVSVEKIVQWCLGGNQVNKVPEYQKFLLENQIVVLDQQSVQNPKGHNSPRLSLKREMINNGALDEHKRYLVLFIPQPIQADAERFRAIERKFLGETRDGGDYKSFLANWTDAEVVELLDYLNAKNEAIANYQNPPEYAAQDTLGKVKERLKYLHHLFKVKERGLEVLAKRALEEAIANRFKVTLQELLSN